jgi:hypothetical protein
MKFQTKVLTTIATTALGFLLFQPAPVAAQQQYTASDSWEVGPGDYILTPGVPDCGGHEFDAVGAAAQAIAAYEMGGFYGSLSSVLNTAREQFQPKLGGDVGKIMDQLFGSNRVANCVPASVVIPAGARVVGIEYQASDGSGTRPCFIGQDCQIGWSRFDPPQYFQAGNELVISSIFRNWSADRTRNITMTVRFVY